MLRRLTLTAVASLAALSAAAPAATAFSPLVPLPPLPVLQGDWPTAQDTGTRLTVTVSESGNPAADGVFELECGPAGGSHPAAQRACDLLDEAAVSGDNPFVATDRNAMCTQQAGGPASARVQGTWQGEDVDARFSRANGCEIARWNSLVPVLPSAR
ncbi:SSI family serine proteinase inhibitor [Streptomyces atroolivaceus]|uniref:SSI family serine proteinase inhibitor n=1 Tax=Streptomyces atroolivaceus TaxID=66869 RepID=UPI0020242ECD|nr:SSI family serine proteinase inhibitor [Streptomyces atroolivaceus]